jgi:hypothetical protein
VSSNVERQTTVDYDYYQTLIKEAECAGLVELHNTIQASY